MSITNFRYPDLPTDSTVRATLTVYRDGLPDEVVSVPYHVLLLVYQMCTHDSERRVVENVMRDDGN